MSRWLEKSFVRHPAAGTSARAARHASERERLLTLESRTIYVGARSQRTGFLPEARTRTSAPRRAAEQGLLQAQWSGDEGNEKVTRRRSGCSADSVHVHEARFGALQADNPPFLAQGRSGGLRRWRPTEGQSLRPRRPRRQAAHSH